MEQNNYKNVSINLCPRCQQKLIGDTRICTNCGYDLDSSTKTEAILSFGLKESVVVSSDETTETYIHSKRNTIN